MDPQACLARIIEIVRHIYAATQPVEDLDCGWSELAEAFDNLHSWLQKGGFPPVASGAILGTGPVAVGYPGMTFSAAPRVEQRPVRHVRDRQSDWRFAIMTKDEQGEDLSRWVFESYDYTGAVIQRWDFGSFDNNHSV